MLHAHSTIIGSSISEEINFSFLYIIIMICMWKIFLDNTCLL